MAEENPPAGDGLNLSPDDPRYSLAQKLKALGKMADGWASADAVANYYAQRGWFAARSFIEQRFDYYAQIFIWPVKDLEKADLATKVLNGLIERFLEAYTPLLNNGELKEVRFRLTGRLNHWKAQAFYNGLTGGVRTSTRTADTAKNEATTRPGAVPRLDFHDMRTPQKRLQAKKPARRNTRYERIDKALAAIADACPKNHEEVFRILDNRMTPIPNRRPFKPAGGWLKGFKQDQHCASAWLSQMWKRLELPAFARGPKK